MDRGFFVTLQAMRRQLAAMPCDYYQIRLIHGCSRRPFPGEQVGSAVQLSRGPLVRFLRLRNREGYDVFFHPWEGRLNAGYILVDLDRAEDNIIDIMRANGHEPCAVLRTSPGHLQAWVRVSLTPLELVRGAASTSDQGGFATVLLRVPLGAENVICWPPVQSEAPMPARKSRVEELHGPAIRRELED